MRWLFAWMFYWLGDFWYRAFQWSFNDHGIGWVMFSIEQRLFLWSDTIQGTGRGPWEEPGATDNSFFAHIEPK